jgi:2-polyprenyl-6-methoxyphenol hydroxylase-like FAD-dependent oxidoreductase
VGGEPLTPSTFISVRRTRERTFLLAVVQIRPLDDGATIPQGRIRSLPASTSLGGGIVHDVVRPQGRVHVIGAGPVGLLLTALLQSVEGQQVRLYERRAEYTRTRMVSLASYLVADSIESYKADAIDGQDVEAIFDPVELTTRLAYRRTVAPDLRALLDEWSRGFVALNTIENRLSALIESRDTGTVERVAAAVGPDEALTMLEPGDVLVDCTGTRSLMRDRLLPGGDLETADRNTKKFQLEYALVITFLYGQHYVCDEYCKYYKNLENTGYKFIPAVHRTSYDGDVTHVTGIVTIDEAEFEAMPPRFEGAWLREHFPNIALSMDGFINRIEAETHGALVGDLEITRIPLDVYHAWNVTSRGWHASGLDHPLARTPVFLLGDSAIGSPYFQSISLGLECAFHLAGHLANRALPMAEVYDRYELFMYQQWLRVYMRSQMIKHNKDLLLVVDDIDEVLARLHVY